MAERALLLVDHGSRRAEANAQLEALAELVAARAGDGAIVRVAHMELASPSIAEGVAACVAAGAREVIVVPCFLAPGRHVIEDLPRLVAEAIASDANEGVRWRVSEPLGVHPLLAELVLVRADLARGERVVLWRQDDHGNRFEVGRFDSMDEARAALERFEEHTHKQCYWLEREAGG